MERAALYLRSSKDRHDVSIESQRADLHRLAENRGLTIVEEFDDVVESGKDEDRPGFLRLISAVRNPRRGWSTILALDTSRIARRRHIAIMFEELECKPNNVRVGYRTLPEELDPGMEVILKSVLQGMDEWHSISSRQKGLAGMAQNVSSGFRAGGRAPYGYRLHREPTGAVREGAPVMKSRLERDENAPCVQAFLRARAAGTPRALAARQAGLKLYKSSLVGLEWNALTYAGHTVWNVHAARKGGRAIGGHRRRPRSEWKICRDTHEALITDAEAEAIIAALAAFSKKNTRLHDGKHLLTGLLCTPAGGRWFCESREDAYRTKSRYVPREPLEKAVVGKVMADLSAERFVDAIVAAARSGAADDEQVRHGKALRERVGELATRISRMMDMAAQMAQPGPALRKIEELERERVTAIAALDQWEVTQAQCASLAHLDGGSVRRALLGLADELRDHERDQVKTVLTSIVDKVVLDPQSFACAIHYRIPAEAGCSGPIDRIRNAYPWGRHLNPVGPAVLLTVPLVLRGIHPALRARRHGDRRPKPILKKQRTRSR